MKATERFSESQQAALHELTVRARRRLYASECADDAAAVATDGRSSVLFTGIDSRGARRAAEQLAHELGTDLYRVALRAVASKYVGETEKNLNRVLETAAKTGAVLLLDEGDSLFGRPDERREDDRYDTLDVNYLLQRIDTFAGVVIVACSRRTEDLGLAAQRFGCVLELQAATS